MTLQEILKTVQTLPVEDQLALIEATSHMVRETIAVEGENGREHERPGNKKPTQTSHLQEIVAELLSRPNPPPEKMLKPGVFAGRIPDLTLEDFEIAEWHPPEEEQNLE